jgi:hypothetical protein
MKVVYPANVTAYSSAIPDTLEMKQRQFLDLIVNHYQRFLHGEAVEHLFVNLDGKAGTCNTHIIMLISSARVG